MTVSLTEQMLQKYAWGTVKNSQILYYGVHGIAK